MQQFFEERRQFFILIWLLSDFLTCLKNYFANSVNFILSWIKKGVFWIFDIEIFWNLFAFVFLSYTRIFWRKLSIFHFNFIVIWLSNMFKELFQNSANFIPFWAKKGDFWFFDFEIFWNLFTFAFLSYTRIFLKKVVYFSF